MPFPYNKPDSVGIEYLKSVTSPNRVAIGADILPEYHHDEMPEYGVFQPDVYIEAENVQEVSAVMKYGYDNNIPVVVRGAGTGLAGGSTCKYGGIMLLLMRMNRIFPIDHKNQTVTCEPGALLLDVQAAAAAEGLFHPTPAKKPPLLAVTSSQTQVV